MGRDINEQRNLWGAAGDNTVNAQRADLWSMDLSNVVNGLNAQIGFGNTPGLAKLQSVPTYFIQSVALPELKVNAEAFRRESRPYMMPLNDEPPGDIKVKFYLENPTTPQGSVVYRLLDTWRAFVRAGRGAYSTEGYVDQVSFSQTLPLRYAFDTALILYRGSAVPQIIDNLTAQDETNAHYPLGATNDLKECGSFTLSKTWLSSFRVSELNYAQGNQLVLIEATFYADNIADTTPSFALILS